MLATYQFGEVLWTMLVFFFWFMAIWIFIMVFADIFRRNDLSGWAKAGWIFLIFIVPFLGAIIYLIARPKMTEQDKEMMEKAQEAQRSAEVDERIAAARDGVTVRRAGALLGHGSPGRRDDSEGGGEASAC